MIPELDSLGLRVLSALGNGIYQGLLLTVCVLVALRLFRRASAATRYAVEFVTLVTVALLPVAHFLLEAPAPQVESTHRVALLPLTVSDAPETTPATEYSEEVAVPSVIPRPRRFAWTSNPTSVPNPESTAPNFELGTRDTFSSASHSPITEPAESHEAQAVEELLEASRLPEDVHASGVGVLGPDWRARFAALKAWFRHPIRMDIPPALALTALGVWMVIALIRLGILVRQCGELHQLKARRQPAPAALHAQFETLHRLLGVRRQVTLGLGSSLRSPIAIGFLRPAILVPDSLALSSPAELDALIRHELAHVHRRDDWTNLVQQGIKALLFLHPAVILLSRRLTLDREIACDDHVLANTRQPRAYALFLTDFACRTRGRQWAAAPAAWSNPSQLRERIQMILDSKRNASPRIAPTRVGILTLTALFIAATGLYAAPRLALDSTGPADNVAETSADSTSDVFVEGTATLNVDTTVDVDEDFLVNTLVSTDVLVDPSTSDEFAPSKPKPPRVSSTTITAPSGLPRAKARSVSIVAPSGALAVVTAPHPTPAPHPMPAPHALPAPRPDPNRAQMAPGAYVKPKAKAHAYVAATASSDQGSLEDRMRRLEQMVESIARRQGVKIPENHVQKSFEHSLNWNFEGVTKDLAKEISREVERATREAERAIREAQKSADKMREEARSSAAATTKERKPVDASLQQHRANLRRQIAQMERQLEGLENELDRLEDKFEQAEDLSEQASELEQEVEQHRKHIEKEREWIEKSREPRAKVKESATPPSPDAPPAPELQKH